MPSHFPMPSVQSKVLKVNSVAVSEQNPTAHPASSPPHYCHSCLTAISPICQGVIVPRAKFTPFPIGLLSALLPGSRSPRIRSGSNREASCGLPPSRAPFKKE